MEKKTQLANSNPFVPPNYQWWEQRHHDRLQQRLGRQFTDVGHHGRKKHVKFTQMQHYSALGQLSIKKLLCTVRENPKIFIFMPIV